MKKHITIFITILICFVGTISAQDATTEFVVGDALLDAPALAYRGDYHVGVRTMTVIHADQPDPGQPNYPRDLFDRELTLEIWYPAALSADDEESITYEEALRNSSDPENPLIVSTTGRAARDAMPLYSENPYPLVIVSHGYPGTRFELSNISENLASKGYVVVAIDHNEPPSLGRMNTSIPLLHRAFDIEFVLNQIGELSTTDDFLTGLVNADNTALIGFSMGGYGTLNMIGAGYNPLLGFTIGMPINPRLATNADYLSSLDTRIKVAVLIAPFGGDLSQFGYAGTSMWLPASMGNITIPTFWMVGTNDTLAVADAVVRLFDESVNSERYLLTYYEAEHGLGSNPPPTGLTEFAQYERYADNVWDKRRINNINQHFITAFLGLYLKGDESLRAYIEPEVQVATGGVWSTDDEGNFTDEHTYWAGFLPTTALGLELRFEKPE